MSAPLAFVDTETTGLDADLHEIWEVGLIVDGDEYLWHLPVDLGRADAMALKIGRFRDRYIRDARDGITGLREFALNFAELTDGRHLVGAVISFDEERLRRLLRRNGACPTWHYHLIDVEALAAGWLMRNEVYSPEHTDIGLPPWDSNELSRGVGVDPDQFDRHTALGDARWARAIYRAVMGS